MHLHNEWVHEQPGFWGQIAYLVGRVVRETSFFGGRTLRISLSEGSKVSASKSNPQASTLGNLSGLVSL
jgi:hypothetical protein